MSGTKRALFLNPLLTAFFVLFVCLLSPIPAKASTKLEALNFSLPKNTIQRPTAAAESDDGRIFVCDAAKQYVAVFAADNTPLFTFNRNLKLPIDIALSDTRVFVLDEIAHAVFVYDYSGEYKSTLGTHGLSAGQFDQPRALMIDGDTLYVADTGNNRIQLFDADTLELKAIFAIEENGTDLKVPSAIAIFGDTLYVVESGGAEVNAYDKTTGVPLEYAMTQSAERDIDITVIGSELALSSPASKQIKYYDMNLGYLRSLPTPKRVYQLSAAPSGRLLACGSTSRTGDALLYGIAADGSTTVIPGSNMGFNGPSALAKDKSGNFYVADTGNHRVLVFNSNLSQIDAILDIPQPLDIQHSDNYLYVLDASDPALLVYDDTGALYKSVSLSFIANPSHFELLSETQALICGSSDLCLVDFSDDASTFQTLNRDLIGSPVDVAVFDGYIYLLNRSDGEILYISLTDSTAYLIPLSAMGPAPSDAASIAVADDGTIYIADTAGSKLYCYNPNFTFDQKISTELFGFASPTHLYTSGNTLYLGFSASNIFAELTNPVATGDYYITLDEHKLSNFDAAVTTYSVKMSAEDDYVDIDCVVGNAYAVDGDIGRYLLFYGLNTFSIDVSNGETETTYTLYITRRYPDGFTTEGLDDYIAYTKKKDSGEPEDSPAKNTKNSILLDLESLNIDGLTITSFSKDAEATVEGDQVRIVFSGNGTDDPPIIQIASGSGLVTLSADALERLLVQKRNQYLLYTAFVGVGVILLVYFFMDYMKKHPGKRHYKRIKK